MSTVTIPQALQLALAHHQAGRLAEAEGLYRQVLAVAPQNADALHLLGLIAHGNGQSALALELISQAVTQAPDRAAFHNNLGEVHRRAGRVREGVEHYRRALALQPDYPDALNNLGLGLETLGLSEEAVACLRRSLALRPGMAEAHYNLGNALRSLGRAEESMSHYRSALALRPAYVEAHNNLGLAARATGQYEEAIAHFRRALATEAHYIPARLNLGLEWLRRGHFPEGWKEYEWRWRAEEAAEFRRSFGQPQWEGEELHGRTILLHAEQGYGDTLQMMRYGPLVAARGGRVVLEGQPELKALLEDAPGVSQWVTRDDPLPPFEAHCPLMSLPMAFGTVRETIPAGVPYLTAPAAQAEWWRGQLGQGAQVTVGLAWAGSPRHTEDRQRSVAPEALAPLLEVEGTRFFSLQKVHTAMPANTLPRLCDRTAELRDFSDTAALVANLDLVISVDTAVAHLAGALGKPVWTLLPSVPDWRWGLEREESDWYPTMRLFRQTTPGDWSGVVRRVATALRERVADGGRER